MTRLITQSGEPFTLKILVPSDKAQTLTAKGFSASGCSMSAKELQEYRQRNCAALVGNDAVQNRIEQVLGVRAETLCTHAKAVEAALGLTEASTSSATVN